MDRNEQQSAGGGILPEALALVGEALALSSTTRIIQAVLTLDEFSPSFPEFYPRILDFQII